MHEFLQREVARRRVGLVTLVLVLCTGVSRAQPEMPEGLPAGPWLLAPSLSNQFQIDNNLFRDDESTGSEKISSVTGALRASLPFRSSLLQLSYAATKRNYESVSLSRDLAQDLGVMLRFDFSSGDQLIVRDDFRRDFTRLRELDVLGNEVVFSGQPYNVNRWSAQLTREVPQRQGYDVQVRRTDFNFEGESQVGIFDYRGFDTDFEYRQPLPASRWWIVHYSMRRFNNYESNCPSRVGIPFRKEESDSLQTGLRGRLGPDHSYFVRLGYVRFRLEEDGVAACRSQEPGAGSTEYDGAAGQAGWRLRLGDRTDIVLGAYRQPLPSGFNTYYIVNELRAELQRDLFQRGRLGLVTRLGRNEYGKLIDQAGCDQIHRKDNRLDVEGEFTWLVHPRIGLQLAALHERRGSNCEINDYRAMQLGAGLVLGWF